MTSRVASFIRLLVLSLCDEYGHVWTENVAGAHSPDLKLSVLVSSGCIMRICHSSTSRTRPNALRHVRQTNTSCLIENHVSAFTTSSNTPAVWRLSVALTQGSYEPFDLPIECMVVIMKRHPHVARTSTLPPNRQPCFHRRKPLVRLCLDHRGEHAHLHPLFEIHELFLDEYVAHPVIIIPILLFSINLPGNPSTTVLGPW